MGLERFARSLSRSTRKWRQRGWRPSPDKTAPVSTTFSSAVRARRSRAVCPRIHPFPLPQPASNESAAGREPGQSREEGTRARDWLKPKHPRSVLSTSVWLVHATPCPLALAARDIVPTHDGEGENGPNIQAVLHFPRLDIPCPRAGHTTR